MGRGSGYIRVPLIVLTARVESDSPLSFKCPCGAGICKTV